MKQYLDQQQTAKLIELGFEKPKSVTEISWREDEKDNPIINANSIEYTRHYSIGELIEMLPQYLDYKGGVVGMPIDYYSLTIRKEVVMYCDPYMDWIEIKWIEHEELIDNLFDACVELKEEGVI